MNINLNNKTALVTGASRGIGKAIAMMFAEAGATIAVHYHNHQNEAEEVVKSLKGQGHFRVKANLADPVQVKEMFDEVLVRAGRINILVNNAGIYEMADAMNLTYDEFQDFYRKTMEINLHGPAHLSYLAAKSMKVYGGGKIINITSRGAFRGEPMSWPYGAAKAGLNSLGQSMAKALAKDNIMVFTIAPGFVETDMSKDILEGPEGNDIKMQSPLNRAAQPEEIARLALFLAGEQTDYMTGCIVDVNGASYLRS